MSKFLPASSWLKGGLNPTQNTLVTSLTPFRIVKDICLNVKTKWHIRKSRDTCDYFWLRQPCRLLPPSFIFPLEPRSFIHLSIEKKKSETGAGKYFNLFFCLFFFFCVFIVYRGNWNRCVGRRLVNAKECIAVTSLGDTKGARFCFTYNNSSLVETYLFMQT